MHSLPCWRQFHKNPPVTVWEMLINPLKSLFRNGEQNEKWYLKSVSRTGAPPKIDKFFQLVDPVMTPSFDEIGSLLFQWSCSQTDRHTDTQRNTHTDGKAHVIYNTLQDAVSWLFMTRIQEEDSTVTRGQSNLTKSVSRRAHSPVRDHPRGSKFVPLNSWGRVSY